MKYVEQIFLQLKLHHSKKAFVVSAKAERYSYKLPKTDDELVGRKLFTER